MRDRKDDILMLAEQFLIKYDDKYKKNISNINEKAKEKLLHYEYPGNARELENIIMSAVSMADDEETLTEKHILISGEEIFKKNQELNEI